MEVIDLTLGTNWTGNLARNWQTFHETKRLWRDSAM
jgi:hypothetical protein